MAQFTAQGRLKPIFNSSDGISTVFEMKEQKSHHHKKIANGFQTQIPLGFHHNHKFRFQLASKLFASSSSSSSSVDKSKRFKVEEEDENLKNEDIFYDDDDDDDDDNEDHTDDLSCFRGLVLDISYRPVNVVCWKRAICLEFMEKADVLEYYDQSVNSPSGSFYIPAVLRVPHLLQVVKRRRIKSTLSRKNIFYRDSFTCQYCSSRENLTIDHVLPIARGGEWTWDNLVTACAKCNSRKGPKTVEEANMKLIKAPKVPKDYDILAIPLTSTAIRMLKLRKGMPDEWRQYLSEP